MTETVEQWQEIRRFHVRKRNQAIQDWSDSLRALVDCDEMIAELKARSAACEALPLTKREA